jgi:L-alanine-DL-glutamate epimerase-like enolase superfamily enzyme
MADVIRTLVASAYRIPTVAPESDGTLEWDSTTLVLVEIEGCGKKGIGYTYGDAGIASFIKSRFESRVVGRDPFAIRRIADDLAVSIRNEGRIGLTRMAISAVDVALWDLKAKILGLPLCQLIGAVTDKVLLYGSGGFTSLTDDQLAEELGGWARDGFNHVKMKVGRQPEEDAYRIDRAREAIGPNVSLFVDANGAYERKQALQLADRFARHGVTWFEEPVTSDDLEGLRYIREGATSPIRVAAGEYAYFADDFLRLLRSQAVDVLQADATRCGGITGFLQAATLSNAFHIPFSFHCAPALHLHAALCVPNFFIGEYFADHARVEGMLFDGVVKPVGGFISPDLSAPGLGLEWKAADAAAYKIG